MSRNDVLEEVVQRVSYRRLEGVSLTRLSLSGSIFDVTENIGLEPSLYVGEGDKG